MDDIYTAIYEKLSTLQWFFPVRPAPCDIAVIGQFPVGEFVITPIMGLAIIVLIGAFFFVLCVRNLIRRISLR